MKKSFPTCENYFKIEARLTKEEAVKLMEQIKELNVIGILAETDDGDLVIEDGTVSQVTEMLSK